MLCYISQPNGRWKEVKIDPKQTGQVVIDEILENLGNLETDYFGLQYTGPKGEKLWLNLRNRICDHELTGPHVYKLSLRIKYFIQPHLIQQEYTKEMVYIQVKEAMAKGLIALTEPDCDEAKLAQIVALITQADSGDQMSIQKLTYLNILQQICPGFVPSQTLIEQIHMEHSKLHGVPRVSAHYLMLKEASSLPGYGAEEHRTTNAQGVEISFRVGPEGITLQDSKTKAKNIIPYTQIRLATHNDKSVHIELIDDAGEPQSQECFRLISRKAAVALYRCITEMHSFYCCDTVCSDVHSQYCRDIKGTFVSIFNENSELGKKYIFDIQRTCHEAYDLVRRKLYAKSSASSPAGSPVHSSYISLPFMDKNADLRVFQENLSCTASSGDISDGYKNLQNENKHLKQRIESYEESLLCCICMNHQVNVVLCPCGHMTCELCAERIEHCPQCRTDIKRFQKVFHSFGGFNYNKAVSDEEQMQIV